MSIRLIVTDMDGTLLDAHRQVTEHTRQVIRKCLDRGILFALASGRSSDAIGRFIRESDIKGCIIMSCNGAHIEDSEGNVLFEHKVDPDIAKEAAKRLVSAGLYLECYATHKNYMANLRPMKERDHKPGINKDGTLFMEDPEKLIEVGTKDARKLIMFSDDIGDQDLTEKLLADLPLDLSKSSTDNVEIMDKGAGKGEAVRKFAELTGIKKDEIMAFGDQTNDISMLLEAGTAVAMENAVDEVKRIADVIAPPNYEDGEAQIIEKLVLNI